MRSAAQPSDGLFRYFAPNRAGTFSLHMLRAACPTAPDLTSDYVPAYLDSQRYQRWFASFDPVNQRNIRRAVPLAIVQLIDGCDVDTAADQLSIPTVSAQTALIRAGQICRRADRDEDFRRLIGVTAADLQADPIHYGHRRRYFSAHWDLPEQDWQRLQTQMLAAGVARQDTPWQRRRTDLRIWLWSHITSGDPLLAPMVRTYTRHQSTDEAIASYSTLRRRAAPALHDIVAGYATDLAEQIDSQARLPTTRITSGRLHAHIAGNPAHDAVRPETAGI
jgi:hypothetical protein